MCLGELGRVVARREQQAVPVATVDVDGRRLTVSLVCLPQADVGDLVLVHSGVALQRLTDAAWREAQALRRPSGPPPGTAASPPGAGGALPHSPVLRRSPDE